MGVYDTIYLNKQYICPMCGRKIDSIQVKEFENILENYRIKDCVSHTEEVRIVKDSLFCSSCLKDTGISIYIVVNRGILLGTAKTLEEARTLLDGLNLEKLILWYHDLYRRYVKERREKHSYGKFLDDLREWHGKKAYEESENKITRLRFIHNLRHLEGTLNAMESVERFITYKDIIKTLDELREEGYETLDIYYPEEVSSVEEAWSVDVCQEEINKRCRLDRTWRVVSKKKLEVDGKKENELPEWVIVVEEPFSKELVSSSVERWLRGRGYEFKVRLVSSIKRINPTMLN